MLVTLMSSRVKQDVSSAYNMFLKYRGKYIFKLFTEHQAFWDAMLT